MAKSDYKNKSIHELTAILAELKAKALQLSFDLANNKLKDTSDIKKNKKEIARILTEIKHQNNHN